VEAGQGPLVLLLHGFPEFWYAWRKQIPALARQFRVVAPDLRGYNLSDKPPGGYDLDSLVRDVPALIEALGERRASVVGHDWGAVIGWGAAMWAADPIERLVTINGAPPAAYLRELRRNPRQWLKSWYVVAFQIPGLAERLLGAQRCRRIVEMLRASSVSRDTFTAEELTHYRRAMCRPGALPATLGYYRAVVRIRPRQLLGRVRPTSAPTLVIWGERDVAVEPGMVEGLEALVPGVRVERIVDAGHWVQHEQPQRVNQLLLEFLRLRG
jgi:pimeloyl-ACP methyl ester carboxylesterase